MNHVKDNRLSYLLFFSRLFTLTCIFLHLIYGTSVSIWYQRAMLSNAVTSSLRLHQRVQGNFVLSRVSLMRILSEDSCHYLLYSLMFATVSSFSGALIPLAIFAILNCVSFIDKLIVEGVSVPAMLSAVLEPVRCHQTLLREMAALAELLLAPLILLYLVVGAGNLLLLGYIKLLLMRASSVRNPHTRRLLAHICQPLLRICDYPQCPSVVRAALTHVRDFVPSS